MFMLHHKLYMKPLFDVSKKKFGCIYQHLRAVSGGVRTK